jgi:hypothetical protein
MTTLVPQRGEGLSCSSPTEGKDPQGNLYGIQV